MVKPELSFEEYKQIADLIHNPGYKLLLECLQANLDNLAQKLQDCEDINKQSILLGKWRAFREILAILINQPQYIALQWKELEEQEENKIPNRVFSNSPNISQEAIAIIKKQYEKLSNLKQIS